MAQMKIDSSIINAVLNDDITALLHKMIDDELSKSDEEVDVAFIDECVSALLELEQDKNKGFSVLIPLVSANEYLNRITGRKHWNALNRRARVAVAAAALAASTIVANAAVTGITGINPLREAGIFLQSTIEELTSEGGSENNSLSPKPPVSKQNAQKEEEQTTENPQKPDEKENKTSSDKPTDVKKTDEKTQNKEENKTEDKNSPDNQEAGYEGDKKQSSTYEEHLEGEHIPAPKEEKSDTPVFSHIEAELKGFKHNYIYGETLSYSGVTVYAVYSDKSKKEVPLSKCSLTESVNMNKTADYTLRIIYEESVIKIPITVRPDEETRGSEIGKNDDFDYLITKNGIYLTAYHGGKTALSLDEIEGRKVYAVAASVFEGTSVKTVSLPNAEKIFKNAFKNCKSLTECSTPKAKYIGDSAFEGCEKLENADAQAAAAYLGKSAYAESGIKNIVLPSGISAVPEKLCNECSKLKTANISGAATVGKSAFSNCTSLEEVRGTANLKTVKETAFYGDEIATFETAPGKLESVLTSGFAYCKKIKFGEVGKLKEIGDYAFMYCSGLTGAELDGDIKTIPQGVFWGCRIKEFTIPKGIKRIENAAFMSTMLSKITIPESVQYIGARAFQTASGLSVTFKCSPEIENSAFFINSRLKFFAYEDSSAIAFAIENDIDYEIIERS